MVWLRSTATALAAFVALTLTAEPGFGQEAPAPPPGEAAPDARAVEPGLPEGRPPQPDLSAPPVLPSGMGFGGRDCESERAPGLGV